jgi:UDP:flavonoid glycosyltransferase YjiC (YdhE family)
MHITILTYGSRGDVEPFVALGKGLLQTGYRVRLAAPQVFASLVSGSDVDFVGLPGDPEQLVRGLVDQSGKSWPRMVGAVSRFVMPLAARVFETVLTACRDTEAVVHSFLLTLAGYEAAKQRGIPDISVQLFPVFCRTGEFPAIVFPDLPLGDAYRRTTHRFLDQSYWQVSRVLYRQLRRSNSHLPRLTGWPFRADNHGRPPILYAFSRHVVSRPTDWRGDMHVTGYWFRDGLEDWQPPQELVDFLRAGPPPVCITLGSTVTGDNERLARVVSEALDISCQRGVIVGTELPVEDGAADILRLDFAPYGWLFPRTAGVVHHGGAGTTGEGLRAGIPSAVVPFTSDQPFWGRRVHDLGVGPVPIPASRLSAGRLAAAIEALTGDDDMRRRAESLARAIREEDGVGEAIRIIDRYLGGSRARKD